MNRKTMKDKIMMTRQTNDDHHCSVIEKKRLNLEIAQCNSTYNSDNAREACCAKAIDTSKKREMACKYS